MYFKPNLCNYSNGSNQYSNTINDNNNSNVDNLLTINYVYFSEDLSTQKNRFLLRKILNTIFLMTHKSILNAQIWHSIPLLIQKSLRMNIMSLKIDIGQGLWSSQSLKPPNSDVDLNTPPSTIPKKWILIEKKCKNIYVCP